MDDLDRIINNLEAQQKNLATFGVPGEVEPKRFHATQEPQPGDTEIAVTIEGTKPKWETE
jgi:hypothetical protein